MKLSFTQPFIAGICFSLLSVPPHTTIIAERRVTVMTGKPEEENDPALKTKASSSRNNHAVRIYPDVVRKVMHVVAKDNSKEIDFFVFDLEGTLVKHYKMNGGDHQKLTNLTKGKYVYHVFAGDEETARGQFEMR